jgi:hypothetical protein
MINRHDSISCIRLGFIPLTILFVVLTIFMTVGPGNHSCMAAQVTLAWDANTDPAVTGYKLYYGYASRTYGTPVDVGNVTQYSLTSIEEGKKSYFAVTAYDANRNESAFSTELECFTITPALPANGTITPASAVVVSRGMSQAFTIAPAANYVISDVLVDNVSVGPVTTYTFPNIDNNHSLSAVFSPIISNYTITASADANGTISPSGSISVAKGAAQAFTVTANTGYNIKDVLVNGSSVGAVTSYTLSNVTADGTISAVFAPKTYTITASVGANGTISPSGTLTVSYGASPSFTITPSTGYKVQGVTVDGASAGTVTSYTFPNVSASHSISASFVSSTYTIAASAGTGGSISPSGSVTVGSGANQLFTIKPKATYKVSSVVVDGKSVGALTTYTFTNVQANRSISAVFVPKKSSAETSKDQKNDGQESETVSSYLLAGSGMLPGNGGWVEVLNPTGGEAAVPIHVDWPEYNKLSGEMRIATGDIDGDGQNEIIIGLGRVKDAPGIPGGYFSVLDDDYSVLGWGQVEWPEYNAINGETRVTTGDIDGDGIAEIIVGLGPGGEGRMEVFKYAELQLKHEKWLQTGWSDYNRGNGETRPATGDLDGNGKKEVIAGLGPVNNNPDIPGGVFFTFDETSVGSSALRSSAETDATGWGTINWPDYNRISGEMWPAAGNITGDGKDKIVLGLGKQGAGRFEIVGFDMEQNQTQHLAWQKSALTTGVELRPTCGPLEKDGSDEIIIGFFNRGAGILEVFGNATNNYESIRQVQTQFKTFQQKQETAVLWPSVFQTKEHLTQ